VRQLEDSAVYMKAFFRVDVNFKSVMYTVPMFNQIFHLINFDVANYINTHVMYILKKNR